jgi:hypothetical protein
MILPQKFRRFEGFILEYAPEKKKRMNKPNEPEISKKLLQRLS